MPKEYLYGSSREKGGYDLLACSTDASESEKKWVCEHSEYQRCDATAPISWSGVAESGCYFLSKTESEVDFTGRASFTAHHLELSYYEQMYYEDGPVGVLDRYRFLPFNQSISLNSLDPDKNVQQWLPRFENARETLASCKTWEMLLGESGRAWAGVVAVQILRCIPVYLFYDSQRSNLIPGLFKEVWALLPASFRWGRSFNTYVSSCNMTYMLNGTLLGSPVHAKAQDAKQFGIDLTRSSIPAPNEAELQNMNLSPLERTLIYGYTPSNQFDELPQIDLQTSVFDIQRNHAQQLSELKNDFEIDKNRLAMEKKELEDKKEELKKDCSLLRGQLDRLNKDIQEAQEQKHSLEEAQIGLIQSNARYENYLEKRKAIVQLLNSAVIKYQELSQDSRAAVAGKEQDATGNKSTSSGVRAATPPAVPSNLKK